MANIYAGIQLTMNTLQKQLGASKYRACEAVVVPIIVQGRNEVRHIRVEAGIGRPYYDLQGAAKHNTDIFQVGAAQRGK